MARYGYNPIQEENHILVYDGRLSGDMVESDLAKKAIEILESKNIVHILATDNDTYNFENMKIILFIGKEEKNGFPQMKSKAVEMKIKFETLKNDTEIESFISTLK